MREISKTQKLQFATIIIACSLIIYAIGIATNFFGSPIFSMFFIISNETAHNVITYAAVTIAITLTIMALSISLIKKRKTTFPETHKNPVTHLIKEPNESSTIITPPFNNQKITNNPQSNTTEQKNQSSKLPTEQSTNQIPIQPNINKNATTNQETIINKNKITCPNCKKLFTTPLYSLDFSTQKQKLISLCPYCNQPLYEQPKNTTDDWWVRKFKSPDLDLGK